MKLKFQIVYIAHLENRKVPFNPVYHSHVGLFLMEKKALCESILKLKSLNTITQIYGNLFVMIILINNQLTLLVNN